MVVDEEVNGEWSVTAFSLGGGSDNEILTRRT